jgi:peptide-methionine (R)-S-oxide reductase
MRFPTFPTLLRTFHTVSNTTSAFLRLSPAHTLGRTIYNTPQRAVLYRSMPSIPFLGALFGSSSSMADNTNYPVQKTEGEWQTQLSPGAHTLYLHRRMLTNTSQNSSEFSARRAPSRPGPAPSTGCGWPAFWDAVPGAVGQRADGAMGMMRTEIVCNNCGGHLGHIFKGERFGNPKDERHCVNSISINFSPKDEEAK